MRVRMYSICVIHLKLLLSQRTTMYTNVTNVISLFFFCFHLRHLILIVLKLLLYLLSFLYKKKLVLFIN